jgi:hypothetical protein
MNIYYNLSIKAPTHVTISNWVKKVGYYQLSKPKEIAEDWVIIIDESIQIGAEKLLLILGTRNTKIDFTRPLNYTDVLPIVQISKNGWNAQKVKVEIEKALEILGNIKYAVSDKGASINKGLELCKIPHVHDVTHRMANILKKVYKEDQTFNCYMSKLAPLRLQIQQTKWAYLLPPQQRAQSRFLNLKPVMEWGKKMLDFMEKEEYQGESSEIKEKLNWVQEYKAFIKEINQVLDTISAIFKVLKNKGLSKKTEEDCMEYLSGIESTKNGKLVKAEILDYFAEVSTIVKNEGKILCTSDIIESSFGLFKNTISKNALNGITSLSLCIPANTSKLESLEIKRVMEEVNQKMINNWAKENLGESMLKLRKKSLDKNGVKNILKKAA